MGERYDQTKQRSVVMRKKFCFLPMLLLFVLCAVPFSYAQISVIGNTNNAFINNNAEGIDIVVPLPNDVDPGNPDPKKEEPPIVERWDPEAYYRDLRAKTLDQYAGQVAENLRKNLEIIGSRLIQVVTEFTIPSIEEIKATFFVQVGFFEIEGIDSETTLGDFTDRVAEKVAAKIALLNPAERRVAGIYHWQTADDTVKNLANQTIWTLESMTGQEYYDAFNKLVERYMKWPEVYDCKGCEDMDAAGRNKEILLENKR